MTRSRTWTIGTVLVVVMVLIAGWFLVISPKRAKVAELKTTQASTVAQNVSAESNVRQLKLQQKEVPLQQAQIANIKQQIPDSADQPSLIRQLSTAADVSGVDLVAISPTPPAPLPGDPGVTFMATAITVRGNYTNLKLFLRKLEENKRAIVVTGFNINTVQDADAPDTLSMAVSSRVFIGTIAEPATGAAAPTTGSTTPATGTTPSTGNAG